MVLLRCTITKQTYNVADNTMHVIMLMCFCSLLQRYLFMKLTYHEDTPEDYEPPHFKPITEEGLGRFARKPFSM